MVVKPLLDSVDCAICDDTQRTGCISQQTSICYGSTIGILNSLFGFECVLVDFVFLECEDLMESFAQAFQNTSVVWPGATS